MTDGADVDATLAQLEADANVSLEENMPGVAVLETPVPTEEPEEEAPPEAEGGGGTFVFGRGGDSVQLDPAIVTDGESFRVTGQCLEPLYQYEPGSTTPIPALATECTPNEDGTEWTCTLRFGLWTGEEQGLLGSKYFASNPTVPPGKIAADINFELGNIWGRTRDITIFGKGKSTLEDFLEAAAATQGRYVTAEKTLRAGWYYRSDQFNFARIGVPAIWFKSGTDFIDRPEGWGEERHAEWIRHTYHQPSDEVEESWDYDGLVEDAVLGQRPVGPDHGNRDETDRENGHQSQRNDPGAARKRQGLEEGPEEPEGQDGQVGVEPEPVAPDLPPHGQVPPGLSSRW